MALSTAELIAQRFGVPRQNPATQPNPMMAGMQNANQQMNYRPPAYASGVHNQMAAMRDTSAAMNYRSPAYGNAAQNQMGAMQNANSAMSYRRMSPAGMPWQQPRTARGLGGSISSFARGGTMRPGQIGLVGERGPELVLGREPATIVPNSPMVNQMAALQNMNSQMGTAPFQDARGALQRTDSAMTQQPSAAQYLQRVNSQMGARVSPTIPQPTSAPRVNFLPTAPTSTSAGSAPTAAPAAPQMPSATGFGGSLVQQLMQRQSGATGSPQTTEQFFGGAGFALPAGIAPGTPEADSYMKSRLLSMGSANPQMGPSQTAPQQLTPFTAPNVVTPQQGQPGTGMQPGGQQQTLQQLLQQQLGGGGLPQGPGLPGGGQVPGIDPQLQQLLMERLQGGGGPQVDMNNPAFQTDPELMALIRQQATGQDPNMPSFNDVVSGSYEPVAAQLDKIFNNTQTQLFEDLIGRGVLQSGEATSRLTDLADQLGVSKAAAFGQIAMEYAQMRQESIQSAIQQWGILEGNRASNAVTLTAANLDAAVSTQNVAMQTLTSLNTAMAQIASGERIAAAEIGSRERISGQQIASSERIAGMDIGSRERIAQLQAQTQTTVANIGAQAAIQIADGNRDVAMQRIDADMSLEGVDWQRYQTDPMYRQAIVTEMGIRQDTMLAIAQAGAADQILNPLVDPRV